MYYVYVLENEQGEIYVGYTSDLKRRLHEHQSGRSRSTKNRVWTLIYYEAYRSETDARKREQGLKYRGQAKARLKERILGCRLDQC